MRVLAVALFLLVGCKSTKPTLAPDEIISDVNPASESTVRTVPTEDDAGQPAAPKAH